MEEVTPPEDNSLNNNNDNDNDNDKVNYFNVLPVEMQQHIMSFLTLIEICKTMKRVCKVFDEITDVRREGKFYKAVFENNWSVIRQRNTICGEIGEDKKEIEWSIAQRGYWLCCKTLWLQHKCQIDKEWVIQINSRDSADSYNYEGERCAAGLRNGKGRLALTSVYEGCWKNDKRDGIGFQKWTNGDQYDGHWVQNKREGKGVYKYAGGNSYEGDWKDDNRDGKGIQKHLNGDIYDGEVQQGEMHGKGMYKWIGFREYGGEGWRSKTLMTSGKLSYPTGCVYIGDWQNNLMEGTGKMEHVNGSVYEGQWSDDSRHGNGVLKDSLHGTVIQKGEWKDDKFIG